MTPQEVAAAAADHIARVGLNQNGGFFADASTLFNPPDDVSCCVLGAAAVVAYVDDRLTFHAVLGGWLQAKNPLIHGVADWSDDTPQEEVVARLREFAAS
jgi:hypothetical protein